MAIALLTLILFALLTVVPGSFFTMPKAEHQLAANSIADEILDDLSAGPFTGLQPGSRTLPARTLEDGTLLSLTLEIQAGQGHLANLLRQVSLTVSWDDRQKHQRLVRHRRISHLRR